MSLTFDQVQKNVSEIANRTSYNKDLIFELLAAYSRSASSIAKLRRGASNLAAYSNNEVFQRNVVYFKYISGGKLLPAIELIKKDPLIVRYNPRYLIVTDYTKLAAIDTKKNTSLDIKIADIDRHSDFFYGWTGDEITDEKTEAVADRRAAEKMTELYTEIEKVNQDKFNPKQKDFRHDLNVFFSRLLFCFFAEDTKVFSKTETGMFTNAIKDYTQADGSDLDRFLDTLFESFDRQDKSKYSSPFSNFPYVNGGLFSTDKKIQIPKFNPQARKTIIECGSLQWSEINPDIFGSLFQGVVEHEYRSEHQMHYTSVPNILKTIDPLFIDALRDEFDKNYDQPRKLEKLHERIANIKVFDPACGSGNFLVIAYKELRRLESAIIEKIMGKLPIKPVSRIKLDNFYGIEIIDVACEIAKLSLQIAKHQMDIEFEEQFHQAIPFVPLQESGKIEQGNATRIDWRVVCPNEPHYVNKSVPEQVRLISEEYKQDDLIKREDKVGEIWEEIYLISNPPYLGQRNQKDIHKLDLKCVFQNSIGKYKKLDYVCCWFMKGSSYIKGSKAKLAFISTNSICQGVQVEQLWPKLFNQGVEIAYAYKPFKWTNLARDVAGVVCTVISLRNKTQEQKYLIDSTVKANAENINPYLVDGPNIIVKKTLRSISNLHPMLSGCQPREGGFLMLNDEDKNKLIDLDKRVERFIKPMVGSNELLDGSKKWCIWVEDERLEEAKNIPVINERIEKVRDHRLNGNSVERTFARVPYKFVTTKRPKQNQIVIPTVTTGSREYIPIVYLDRDIIVNSRAYCLFDATLEYFSLLSSRMHMTWINVVSGRLGNAINYSSHICYNTYPLNTLTQGQIEDLRLKAKNILLIRQNHSEKTLAEMYDPDKMPEDLRKVHHELDLAVDVLYRDRPYENNQERLSDLFALYEKMTKKEKVNV